MANNIENIMPEGEVDESGVIVIARDPDYRKRRHDRHHHKSDLTPPPFETAKSNINEPVTEEKTLAGWIRSLIRRLRH